LASASFDKSVKLWNGITGKFIAAFRGHVADVYQIRSAASFSICFLFHVDPMLF
jgi:ribosome assembly protein 4